MRKIKKGTGGGRRYYQIDKPPYPLALILPLLHICKVKLQLEFKGVFTY
jgi:hypothetical protein